VNIEAAVKAAGFALRDYPLGGYRNALYILKHTNAPATLIEAGRVGQYTPEELQAMGRAIAAGIANHVGLKAPLPQEVEMTADEVRSIVRHEIDTVSAPAAVAAAQQKLIAAGILSSPHPSGKAASTDLLMIMCARLLDRSGVVDLSGYDIQLVKK
jgi:peptidoglycan/xylan/chitin deacetylase (PgdA/CDA1 family)